MKVIHQLTILIALICTQTFAAEAPRPNIVVFLCDDLGLLETSPYGATDVRTPNLRRLADAGMVFNRAFVASPACAPSRAALLTGMMPARNGAEANHTYARPEIKGIPAYLRSLGYDVAAFGKVAHGKDVDRWDFTHFDQKFSVANACNYDISADPAEAHNLATDAKHADTLKALRAKVDAWMSAQGDQKLLFKEPHNLTEPEFVDTPEGAPDKTSRTRRGNGDAPAKSSKKKK